MLDIKEEIVSFLSGKEDPAKIKSILGALGMPATERQYVKSLLADLVKEQRVTRQGARYWVADGKTRALAIKRGKTRSKSEIVGRLSVSSRRKGFVAAPAGEDWIVPARALGGAKHGDTVRARRRDRDRNGRVIAEIVEIVDFGVSTVLGVFERRGPESYFLPFGNFSLEAAELVGIPDDARDGAVGRFTRRADGRWAFDGLIGQLNDPAVDEAIVLAENGVVAEISEDVRNEADRIAEGHAFDLGDRRDFRDCLTFTVDGADARDFDDALHFRSLAGGSVEVGVHIADVAAFAPPDSALDRWARDQGNSVYLPHKAIPMLPTVLSNGLCSLNPNEPRYTLSLVAEVARDGRVLAYELCKGLIESRFRLTYDDVEAIGIDRDPQARHRFEAAAPAVDQALALARKLRARRVSSGGLNLDMGEIRIELDERGEMTRAVEKRQTDAHRMIEAFMCMANECVAAYINERGVGAPYRIHEPPEEAKLSALADFLRSYGYEPPADYFQNPGRALNAVIGKIADSPNRRVLQLQMLKTMKLAEYHEENRGHFGLASEFYMHFTSPIRRCADLVAHQRLTRMLADPDIGPEHFDDEGLQALCAHLSKKERAAARAEQTFVQIKLLRRMQREVGSVFEGVISEVKAFGFFVTLNDLPASGLVSVDYLADDFYQLVADQLALVGERSKRQFKVGMTVKVRVAAVDLVGRKMDLELLEGGEAGKKMKSRRRLEMERDLARRKAGASRTAGKRGSGRPPDRRRGTIGKKGGRGGGRGRR